jgi:hypothetical protein
MPRKVVVAIDLGLGAWPRWFRTVFLRAGTVVPVTSMIGRLRVALRVVLLLHPSRFSEGLALVKDAQRNLRKHGSVRRGGGRAHLAFGQVFQHPEPVHRRSSIQEAFGEAGDGHISRRIPQFAVLARRTDQTLLLPIAEHTRSYSHLLGESRDRDQLVIGRLGGGAVSR